MLHLLDRYAGIPAVAILGHMRRKRVIPSKIDTFGLLRTAAIGDTVLISAAIADLRSAFPDASIIFFAGPSNIEIARMLDGVDKVVEVPIVSFPTALRRVRSVAVDVMVDFGQWPRFDALLTLHSKALFTIGFKTRGQYRHYGYDVTVEHSSLVHEIENYRKLMRAIGVRTGSRPRLRISSASSLPDNNYAVFHLWPGGMLKKLKQWPSERWVHLIEEFAAWGTKVMLTGTRSDGSSNDAIIDCLQPCVRGYVSNVAGVSLRETAAMLAQARVVVSVNTGVMHMAAALGVPLVALHGPTSSRRWGPIGERAIAVDSPLEGCGYLNLGWEHPSRPLTCMECIPYEAVREACLSAIGKEVESVRAM